MSDKYKRFGKVIKLFLVDGTPNGRWICELSNWTGMAFKIPRSMVKQSEDRDELTSPGVYFLFGHDEAADRPLVYIGEAENIITRLKQHLDHKDNWTEVIALTSKDHTLNKARIKYLENCFYCIAQDCGRYTVDNSTVPTKSSISESDQAELEEFIYNAKILVNALGHKVFEKYRDSAEIGNKNESPVFAISAGLGKAHGMRTADGFLLLKDSAIHIASAESLSKSIRQKVDQSRETGEIKNNTLQNDKLFSSSSAAASFAVGYSISGPQQWKTDSGETLKAFESRNK